MKRLLLLPVGLMTMMSVAQEKKKDYSNSYLPYYDFKKGVGITSPDSLYQVNMRFRIQNRATVYEGDGGEHYDAHIRRTRLRFDGFVGNPKFKYALQLSFTPGDLGHKQGEVLTDTKIIRDAVVSYHPDKHWSFIFGQTKLPGNRQRVNSSGALQLTDRSINNASFNIDRDFGVQINYANMKADDFSWGVRTAISSGKGRNWVGKDDAFALTGKAELYPMGAFAKQGAYFEGDLAREQKPKLMISGGYHFNKKAQLSQGTLGTTLHERRDLSSVFVDAILKYNGWAAMATYMNRTTDNPITQKKDAKDAYVYAGQGVDAQLSYLLPSNYEIIGRYSTQKMDNRLYQLGLPNKNQYSLGLTKYVWEHAFKVQLEASYEQAEYFSGKNKNNYYVRMQVEVGI